MVLGKVKSGAACPTFRVVCGTTGAVRAVVAGDGVGVCAAASEATANENTDAAASKNETERAFLIIFLALLTSTDYLFLIAASLHRMGASDNELVGNYWTAIRPLDQNPGIPQGAICTMLTFVRTVRRSGSERIVDEIRENFDHNRDAIALLLANWP